MIQGLDTATVIAVYAVHSIIPILIIVLLVLLIRKVWREDRASSKPAVVAERVSLGEAIRRRREACGMTQELVAEKLGVSRQAVGKWESGKSDPSTTNLMALAELFGVDAAELLREVKL